MCMRPSPQVLAKRHEEKGANGEVGVHEKVTAGCTKQDKLRSRSLFSASDNVRNTKEFAFQYVSGFAMYFTCGNDSHPRLFRRSR